MYFFGWNLKMAYNPKRNIIIIKCYKFQKDNVDINKNSDQFVFVIHQIISKKFYVVTN